MSPDLAAANMRANAGHGAKQPTAAMLKTAEEFESVFLANMLESMSAGIKTDGPFGGGKTEATYRSMLAGEYAQGIARAGGIGVANQVAREMLALQEMSTP